MKRFKPTPMMLVGAAVALITVTSLYFNVRACGPSALFVRCIQVAK